jgi:hypothetical protein
LEEPRDGVPLAEREVEVREVAMVGFLVWRLAGTAGCPGNCRA